MSEDFKNWSELKQKLNSRDIPSSFHAWPGEIWWCALGKNIGIEINGKNKDFARPVVIANFFSKNHLFVVPLTHSEPKNVTRFHVPMKSFSSQSFAVTSQARAVSSNRLLSRISDISAEDFISMQKSLISMILTSKRKTLAIYEDFSKTDSNNGTDGLQLQSFYESNNGISIQNPVLDAIDATSLMWNNVKMNQEFEVKFLDVDVPKLEEKLRSIGATKVGDYFYKRITFDYPNLSLMDKGAWLRLRDEGDRVTLTWKKRLGMKSHDGLTSDEGMEEIEVVVEDFQKTAAILRSIGMTDKFYQENKRERWKKGSVEFDIDGWPRLKPYLEIEGPSWKEVEASILELGLDPKDKKIFSTNQIYKLAGINELEYSKMTFEGFVKRA